MRKCLLLSMLVRVVVVCVVGGGVNVVLKISPLGASHLTRMY